MFLENNMANGRSWSRVSVLPEHQVVGRMLQHASVQCTTLPVRFTP